MDTEQLLNKAKGIIFDCDGTLVDSMALHMQAWKHAFIKHNVKYNEPFLSSLKGMKESEIISKYNSAFNTKLIPAEVVADKHIFFKEHIDNIKPIDKIVLVAINNFGRKPMAVVSGSVAEIVHKELKIIGIFNLFNTIISANDPFKPKPNPECFLEAANRLKIDPRDMVVFEDGDAGLIAAQKAGMQIIDVRDPGL
jgi:HAD superfamily hydrolase (TIGR01509 family)